MKKLLATLCAGMALCLLASCNEEQGVVKVYNQGINIIPAPMSLTQHDGQFKLNKKTTFGATTPEAKTIAEFFASKMKAATGYNIQVADKGDITLSIDESLDVNDEGYTLDVTPSNVTVKAKTPQGLFYGMQSFMQLLPAEIESAQKVEGIAWTAPSASIKDEPRFGYRGMMIDPCRHFMPVEDIKKQIDVLALFKINRLHWHLTEDQGWRIEIKKYPQLTKVGAFRDEKGGDQGPDNGFYTQEQLKDIIDYAAERHVEIIPELDIPGHTAAVLAVFPEMLCQRPDTVEVKIGKTTDVMMCASNECGYEIYRDILTEVAALFPSPSIHLGGDEAVIEKNWEKCSSCQTLKEKLGYQKSSDLMNHFFGKILTTVRELKKEPILWCELNNLWMPADSYLFNYPKDVTLVSWRAGLTPLCHELTQKSGNPLIMAPGEYAYLDYPQYKGDLPEYNNWGMPITTLEKTYEFDPAYGGKFGEKHIKGVLGTLWSEAIKDFNRVTYMAYPRGLALAEAAWTQMEHRTWDSFKQRICPNLYQMMKDGISFRVPFEIFSSYVCN